MAYLRANMETDRIKWNSRHAEKTGHRPPDVYLQRFLSELTGPSVLDLACGRGRNAFFLAESGFEVTAIDISEIGLLSLQQEAHLRKLTIHCLRDDLDTVPESLKERKFNSIIIINFKPAPEFLYKIPDMLTDEGTLLWCSFNEIQSGLSGFPREMAMQPSEFVVFPGLILHDYSRFRDESGERDGYFFLKPPYQTISKRIQ